MNSSGRAVSVWLYLALALNIAVLFGGTRVVPKAQLALALVALAGANAVVLCLAMLQSRGAGAPQVLADDAHAVPDDAWPVALASFDARGRVCNANSAFRNLFGWNETERIEGTPVGQLMHPDERESLGVLQTKMMNNAATSFSEERRFFRRDGVGFSGRWTVHPEGNRATCLIEDISQTDAAQHALQQARAALHELYDVVAGGRDLDAQIESLLALGCRRFAVETGYLGQVSESRLRLIGVHSADERLRRGQVYDLSSAKREGEMLRPHGPRGLLHADASQSENQSRIFTLCEGETYLGAPILAGGVLWGMLNFSDPEGRAEIASDDGEFLQLMAGWLGGEIERRHARQQLETQQLELVRAAAQLESLAVHDGLTGVKNRRAFDEQFKAEWQRSKRYRTPLSVVLMDVDKFKTFNDAYGHQAGDEVLQRVAQVLGAGVRNIDFLARYGGEEFVLLLPNTDAEGALILANRLRENIANSHWPLREVTASFGLSTIEEGTIEAAALLKSADDALYVSKENGRNCCTHAQSLPSAA